MMTTSSSGSSGGSSSSTVAFAAGALAGAAVSAASLYYIYRSQQLAAPRHPPAAVAASSQPAATHTASLKDFENDEILAEHLTRNVQFFGIEKQKAIASSFVVVIGLGGVGSHAAHLLLRSGVGKLRLVDFDQVTLSSLNRHAVATRQDVGIPKATCLQRHFQQIMPEAEVEAVVSMCTADNIEQLLSGQPDFVLDAIDNIHTKVALLAACKQKGIPVLCVAGAGAKADPTRLRIVDISESSIDPLARAVRHKLRRECGIPGGIPVLLSTEKPRCQLVSMVDMAEGNPLDYQIVPNFRVRTIPVLGTAPAIFGMAAASFILCQLAGSPFYGEPIIQLTGQQYDRALMRLQQREEEVFGSSEDLPVDRDDIILLLREVYRGFSARADRQVLPGGDKGLMRNTAHLHFTRWDAAKPPTVDNLVLLKAEEAEQHDAAGLQWLQQQEPEFVKKVERLLDVVRAQVMY